MEQKLLGARIKQRRRELHLSQEDLCEGLCSVVTISRLESGGHMPRRQLLEALLERLDMPIDLYLDEYSQLRAEVTAASIQFLKSHTAAEKQKNRERTLDAISRLEDVLQKDDTLNRQFIRRSLATLCEAGIDPEQQREDILEALRMTSPRFQEEKIANGIYTTEEILLINHLAAIYADEKRSWEAIRIYQQLYNYILQHFKNISLAKAHFALVAFNYARELDIIGQYEQAIKVAKEGIQAGIRYGNYLHSGALTGVIAECLHFLGDDKGSKEYYLQAYYLSKYLNSQDGIHCYIHEAKKYLGLDLENQ